MTVKPLGNSDMAITPVGFGAWAIGGNWKFGWGDQDDRDSIAAIHRALELGVNWIDTAPAYGLGHSEYLVAQALADWTGPRPYVFTKCGIIWDKDGKVDYSVRAKSIRREIEDSLKRLKVDVIDLYQMHWPGDEMDETLEGWAEMAKLKEEGKVRWIGVSNFSVEELEKASAIAPITSLQPPYSLLKREIEEGQLPYCDEHNVGVIVYSPMGSGMLTGAMTRERAASLPKEDWRSGNPQFTEPKLSENLKLVDRLREVAGTHGRSPGEAAIAWTLRRPEVTAAIVGARNPAQVEGIVGAMDFRLSDEEIAHVEGRA
ncbi:MAG: aldo/keto reductase [Verrucomicrobiota bacterium JB024]|nr:aldo/keto reductase [Verrucomicrobiota bacterium JB024]